MQIELPEGVESLAREKAARAGFHDVGEYVVSLLLHEEPPGDPRSVGVSSAPTTELTDWSEERNARRCELIDKDIQDEITAAERIELATLTIQFREYRRRLAPLPMEGARQLHAQLLEKKRRREQGGEG
jgi:hypothetical protein